MSTNLIKPVKKAVFPVAGLGTRFLPATKVIPKEMIPVVDRPLMQYAIEEAQEAGIEEFILVNAPTKASLEKHFRNQPVLMKELQDRGKQDLYEITEKTDLPAGAMKTCIQKDPLGLGHAVWCAKELVGDEPFALSLVDVMIMGEGKGCIAQMIDTYNETGGNIIAAVDVPREDTKKYGILDVEDDSIDASPIKGMVEKPAPKDAPSTLSIVGRYILQPEIFDVLENTKRGAGNEIQLTDGMADLMKDQPFTSMRFKGAHYDCGHHIGFIEANIAYALNNPKFADAMMDILQKHLNKDSKNHDQHRGAA